MVPMAAGGVDLRAFTASCSFVLLSFARASGMTGALDRDAGCSWGAPWGRGARVEVWRPWGVGGVVPMAAGGVGLCPSAHHVLLLCCLLQGPQVRQELRIGLLIAPGERHGAEVRVLGCGGRGAWGKRHGAKVRVFRCGGRGAWGAWCQWPRGAWIFVPSPQDRKSVV